MEPFTELVHFYRQIMILQDFISFCRIVPFLTIFCMIFPFNIEIWDLDVALKELHIIINCSFT